MGHGVWERAQFETYAARTGRTVKKDGTIAGSFTAQEMYTCRKLSPLLDPKGVIRECCDTPEHPETVPVILALDVTGSMGKTAVEIAKKLNVIMTDLYQKIKDVEFLIMGIGDVMYDQAPIQASQFESDIRIAEQLDQIYFEGGGGGNNYESYTGAWYFGAHHTRLDCWKRGKKGLIITIGDEAINPYLPLRGRRVQFADYMGDGLQEDLDTKDLIKEVKDKYELYHLVVSHDHWSESRAKANADSFRRFLTGKHVLEVTVETLAERLVDLIVEHSRQQTGQSIKAKAEQADIITWGPEAETDPDKDQEKDITTDADTTLTKKTAAGRRGFARLLDLVTW